MNKSTPIDFQLLKFLVGFSVLLLFTTQVRGQNDLSVLQDNWIHFSDAPNSLYRHLTNQAFGQLAQREEKIKALSGLDDWQERQLWTKNTLAKVIGVFPEKTALNAKITGTLNREGYRIEHIVFESQPKFFVSSSLFIPDKIKGKAPAIIYCSGHNYEGYRNDTYMHIILNLVKKGFIVFAFDPVGQGERLEHLDPETGKSLLGGPTKEHSYSGAQAFISGHSQAKYMIWDGIRALDYLLTRKEVDPDRIGITGRSGGGTQAAYIAAVDDRVKAAAVENYITTFTRLLETNGPQDAEQNFLHGVAEGLDQADLLHVRAPKPTLLITTTRDIFSIQGARETREEVARIYRAYGKEDHFSMVEDDAGHASTLKNREAMYGFFQTYLNLSGSEEDEKVEMLTSKELQVTPTGQVSTALKSLTVFDLNKIETEKQLAILTKRPLNVKTLQETAKQLSGYKTPSTVSPSIFTGRIQKEDYAIEKYYTKGEGDYLIPYLLFVPVLSNDKGMIYLHPSGKASEASEDRELDWLVKQGFTVLAPDLVGLGEVGPNSVHGDSNFDGVSFNTWFASVQIGRSIVGIQAGDVVRLTRILKEKSRDSEIYGLARKELTPVLLHAALFDASFSRLALIDPLISYKSLVTSKIYDPSFIPYAVPAALTGYDLPDIAAAWAPKPLLMVWGQKTNSGMEGDKTFEGDVDLIKNAYSNNSQEKLIMVDGGKGGNNFDLYQKWFDN